MLPGTSFEIIFFFWTPDSKRKLYEELYNKSVIWLFQDDFIIRLKEDQEPNFTIEIYDMLGRVIYDETHLNANHAVIQSPKVSGIYNVRISYPKEDGKEVVFDEKVMVYWLSFE